RSAAKRPTNTPRNVRKTGSDPVSTRPTVQMTELACVAGDATRAMAPAPRNNAAPAGTAAFNNQRRVVALSSISRDRTLHITRLVFWVLSANARHDVVDLYRDTRPMEPAASGPPQERQWRSRLALHLRH